MNFTTGLLPVVQWLDRGLAIMVVGALFAVNFLLPSQLENPHFKVRRAISISSCTWAVLTFLLVIFKLAEIVNISIFEVFGQSTMIKSYLLQIRAGQASLIQILGALILASFVLWVRSKVGIRLLFLFSLALLIPTAFSGHSHSGAESKHQLAIVSWTVHIIAISLWIGGVIVLVILGFMRSQEFSFASRAFSPYALFFYWTILTSGIVNGSLRIGAIDQLWLTSYGQIMLAKIALLILLGFFGAYYRKNILAKIEDANVQTIFRKLLSVELFFMAFTVMLGVLLSQTSTPPALAHVDPKSYSANELDSQIIPIADRKVAPILEGKTLSGGSLYDLPGKIRLVNVWASWCEPCKAEAPLLHDLSVQFPGIIFIGVLTRDHEAPAKKFVAKYGIEYPTLIDDSILYKFDDPLMTSAIPTTTIIDKNGRVAIRIAGEVHRESLTALLQKLSAE
jgi:putative copper export protein/peroxiredoxin